MKRFLFVLIIASFSFCFAQEEESLVGETTEEFGEETYNDQPVTNEDKLAENGGKEVNSEPAKKETPKSGNKFNQFVNRKGKKSLVGAKAGLNISHFWDDNNNDGFSDAGAGYFFGLFFEYAFFKNFSLQAEMNFSDKGDGLSVEYFEIPVIAQGVFPVSDMIWINAGAGLYVAFAHTGWATFRNTVDGGMVIKGGLEINTKIGVFVADVRYALGFAKVWSTLDDKNGAFSILAGYAVPLPF